MTLEVDGLRFSYNDHPVLAGIQFGLKPGEILAVLGVNGAGKSTLLKCLNRILRPKFGELSLGGQNLSRMSANDLARHFGYVPQNVGQEVADRLRRRSPGPQTPYPVGRIRPGPRGGRSGPGFDGPVAPGPPTGKD